MKNHTDLGLLVASKLTYETQLRDLFKRLDEGDESFRQYVDDLQDNLAKENPYIGWIIVNLAQALGNKPEINAFLLAGSTITYNMMRVEAEINKLEEKTQ